jgi:hypothetical protein
VCRQRNRPWQRGRLARLGRVKQNADTIYDHGLLPQGAAVSGCNRGGGFGTLGKPVAMAVPAAAWAVIGTAAGGAIGVVGAWVTNLMNNQSSEKLAQETRRHDLVVAQAAALRTARERIYPIVLRELRSDSLKLDATVKQLKAGDWNIDVEKFSGEPTEVWNDVVLYVGDTAADKMRRLFQLIQQLMDAILRTALAIHECAEGTPNPQRNPHNPPLNERNEALENLDRTYEAFGEATDDLLQALRDDMTARPGSGW